MKKITLFMALALMGLSANMANAQTTIASGDCGASGNNLTWVLTDDSVLTISGSGAMADYDYSNRSPWFSNRGKFKTLVIGNSVTTIGDEAFANCSGLISVTLGNSVTTIGSSAFLSCSGLSGALTIPNSVTAIGNGAFLLCSGLTAINVAANNPNYSSNDGILYNKGQDTLMLCLAGKIGAVTIPSSVTTIGESAFWYCSGLTSVILPNSVTTIGEIAFSMCSGLSGALTIPNSVTTIGWSAFENCSGLTSVTIGNSVTTIGMSAFYSCSGLSGTLTIPNSVTTIGLGAFSDCGGLTAINVAANNPNYSSNDGILYNKVQDTLMLCPAGKTGALTIPNSVTFINAGALFYCSELTEITSLAINPPATYEYTFYDIPKTIPIHVPCGSENAYQAADDWREFSNYTDCIGGNGLTDIDAADFNIYPNPAKDRINFSCSEAIKEIEVFNIVGQQIYAAKVNDRFTALNVAGFASGSYIAKLHTAKGILEKKFVVE